MFSLDFRTRTRRYGIEYDKSQNIAASKVRSRGSQWVKYNDTVGLGRPMAHNGGERSDRPHPSC
jgi:hypothetical protein